MLASVDLGKAVRWGQPRQFAALAPLFTPAWAIEEKFDGWRVWVVIEPAGTRLLTATADLTHVAAALAAVRGSRAGLAGTTVLDAEIMAPPLPGETYAPLGRTQSWMRAKPADARMLAAYFKRGPVLKVFDVLTLAGTDVTGNTYDERRAALEALLPMITASLPGRRPGAGRAVPGHRRHRGDAAGPRRRGRHVQVHRRPAAARQAVRRLAQTEGHRDRSMSS